MTLNTLYLNDMGQPLATTLCTLTSILGLILVSFLYVSSLRHRIFAVLSFQVLAGGAEAFSYALYTYIMNAFLHVDATQDQLNILFISKLLLFLLLVLVGLFYHHKKKSITVSYRFSLLLMPAISIVILLCVWFFGYHPQQDILFFLQVMINIALISMCLLNYLLLNVQLQNKELEDTKLFLEHQNQLQQAKYDHSITAYKATRRTIHDTRKHLLYLLEYAQKAGNDEIIQYIQKNLDEFDASRSPINTGNLAVDALIGNCIFRAQELNVPVTTNIQINSAHLPITDYELSILLGNLSDNALQAVSSLPHAERAYIHMELFMSENQLIIRFLNASSSDRLGIYDPKEHYDQLLVSQHGYGLYNVAAIVDAHHGLYHFEQHNSEYEANIILPLEK